MSGLLGGITNAAGAVVQGQNQANQARLQSALQQASIVKQQKDDQLKQALAQRQGDQARQKDAITLALRGYVKPGTGTGANQAIPNAAFGLEDVHPGVQIGDETYDYDPNLDPSARKLDVQRDIAHDRNEVSVGNNIRTTTTSASNNANTNTTSRANTADRVKASVGNNIRTTSTSAANNANTVNGANARSVQKQNKQPSAQAQITAVRLKSAHEQVSQADDFMSAYEQSVGSGKESLNPISIKLAREAIHGSTTAEATLNNINPRLATYVRMQHQIAAAERSYMPRGGSNSLQQTEALLAGAGSNASADQIAQAQRYRKSIRGALDSHAEEGGGATPPADARTPDQKDWDDAVAKYGKDHVLKEYGPRP